MRDSPYQEGQRIARTGDPLQEWARDVIGKTVQLRVPLRDTVDLRRAATILREFANRMEVLSHSKDSTDDVMLAVWAKARIAQAQLQSNPRPARNNRAE